MKKLIALLGAVVMSVAMMGCNNGSGACCGTGGSCCKAAETKCCGTDGKCCKTADAGHSHDHGDTAVN